MSTATRQEVHLNRGEGVEQLKKLLYSQKFEEGIVNVAVSDTSKELEALNEQIRQDAKKKTGSIIQQKAAQLLGKTIEEAMKLGKDWGETLRKIKTEIVDSENGTTYESKLRSELENEIAGGEENSKLRERCQGQTVEAKKTAKSVVTELRKDLEKNIDREELIEALGVWGRSPNAEEFLGEDDRGYNSGVIHYFEYRANQLKNSRYKHAFFAQYPMTIAGFIEYSMRLKRILDNPTIQNSEVIASRLMWDTEGRQCMHILTKENEKIVAFRHIGEDRLRVVTVLPSQSVDDFDKIFQRELTGGRKGRLNQLGEGVKEVLIQ